MSAVREVMSTVTIDGTDARSRRIIVAEDEVLVRLAITEALRAADFIVYEALNGEEAIKPLSTFPDVDAVVTDMSMQTPRDGVTVLNFVRARHPHILVALASAHTAEAAHFDALFPKPSDPTRIVEWLNQQIRTRRMLRRGADRT